MKDRTVLCVLPWVGFKSEKSIGEISFVPWSQFEPKLTEGEQKKYINAYLNIFHNHFISSGKIGEIDPIVTLHKGSIEFPEAQMEIFWKTINLLFFYIKISSDLMYVNSNSFEVFARPINIKSHANVHGPMRGMILDDFDYLLVTKPLIASEFNENFTFQKRESLLKAFETLQQSSSNDAKLIDLSLNFFRSANDDHFNNNDYPKLSDLISSIETLLQKSNKKSVLEELDEILKFKTKFNKIELQFFDEKTKTKTMRSVNLATAIIHSIYKSRNGYLHAGELRGLTYEIEGEKLPLWELGLLTYQILLFKTLERLGFLKWEPLYEKFVQENHFDNELERLIKHIKARRLFQEKRKSEKCM